MSGSQTKLWQRAGELFDVIVELTPAERSAYLASRTVVDPEVREAVERLIVAHELAGDALPAHQAVASALSNFSLRAEDLAAGTAIGPFTVERLLGAGGMGQVYLGRREIDGAVQRVAIKLPNARSTAESMRRFRQERAMLAGLQHPAIARLVDAGELSTSRPYLAMEYVDGEPLPEFCNRCRLSVAERVDMAIRILAGLQYAHERLIVHRDIKSDNVLVDCDGQPRILDFGIGKLLDDTRPSTADGQHYFSLTCAAPEQIRGEPSSAATDVYAVAVLLYELLTGYPPLDYAALSAPEALDHALQSVPLLASQRLRRSDAASLAELAAQRSTTPNALERALVGDVDRVLARALRKNPPERYATASAFADDLAAVLEQRPIAERRSERWYRARQFIARHRLAVGLTAAIVLTLIASIGILSKQAYDLRIARDRAEDKRAEAEQISQFLEGLFRQADPLVLRGKQMTAKSIVDRGVKDATDALREHPERRANLLLMLGRIQLIMSDLDSAKSLGENALATGHETGRARLLLARVAFAAGDFRSAIHHSAAISDQFELGPEAPEWALMGFSIKTTAEIASGQLSGNAAVQALEPIVAEFSRRYGLDHPETKTVRMRLAASASVAGDDERAQSILEELVSDQDFGGESNDPEMAIWAMQKARLERDKGNFDEARRLLQWALRVRTAVYGPQHPRTAASIAALAILERRAGQLDLARKYYELCVEIAASSLPPHNVELVGYRYNLGSFLLTGLGDAPAAIPVLRQAFDAAMQSAELSVNTALFAHRLGEAYAAVGDYKSARRPFEIALKILSKDKDRYRLTLARVKAEITCLGSARTPADSEAISQVIKTLESEDEDSHVLPRLRRCLSDETVNSPP